MTSETYLTILYITVSVITVLSNLATIAAFRVSKALKGKKYYLVTSLAVADMMVGMVTIPCYMYVKPAQIYSRPLKYLYKLQEILFPLVSVLHLAFLSFERYHAVSKPFKHRALGNRTFIYAVIFAWITGFLLALLGTFLPIFTLLFTVMPAIIVALLVVIVCYVRIWLNYKKHSQEFNPQERFNNVQRQSERNLVYTLLITTCLSLITWLPFQVLAYVIGLCRNACNINLYSTITIILRLVHYCNSLLNFFVYSLRIPEFRKIFTRLCPCARRHTVMNHLDNNPTHARPFIVAPQSQDTKF